MMRTQVFHLAAEYGYTDDAKLARAMGVSSAMINRVRHGKRGISQVFITAALRAFPDKSFDDLFIIEPEADLIIA